MNLQGIADGIKAVAAVAGVIVIAFSGFMLITSNDPVVRSQWKEALVAAAIGISIIFLAPLVASFLSGGNYCG